MHEQSDRFQLIEKIMGHPTNQGRDSHTLQALWKTLTRERHRELAGINDRLNKGECLPDHMEQSDVGQ